MIELYTHATPNGWRVSIALEELGLPYEVRRIDLSTGAHLSEDYKRINPIQKIPAIVDDGRAIFGSTAILYHLAETRGRLMPSDVDARTQAHIWLAFAGGDLGPALVSYYCFSVLFDEKLPTAISHFDRETARCFAALEGRLEQAPYLAGSDYSMADIAVFPFVAAVARGRPALVDALPGLRRWHDGVMARPAVVRGMAVPG